MYIQSSWYILIAKLCFIYNREAKSCRGCFLRRVAPNTKEPRSRSGLCERVIRREATETEGLVYIESSIVYRDYVGFSCIQILEHIKHL